MMRHKNTLFCENAWSNRSLNNNSRKKKNNNNKLLKVFAQCKQSIFPNKTFKINIPESNDIDSWLKGELKVK